jgi:hypothetical protein
MRIVAVTCAFTIILLHIVGHHFNPAKEELNSEMRRKK